MAEPFLGQINIFPYNFAPRNWAFCQGQILSIAQNTALFALLGTTYGGNGQTTFALPDLRGRVATGIGQGPGLGTIDLGEMAGTPTETLLITNLPLHPHMVAGNGGEGGNALPGGAFLGKSPNDNLYAPSSDGTIMNPAMIQPTGGNQPFSLMQPFLGLNFCIALQGVFPSRN